MRQSIVEADRLSADFRRASEPCRKLSADSGLLQYGFSAVLFVAVVIGIDRSLYNISCDIAVFFFIPLLTFVPKRLLGVPQCQSPRKRSPTYVGWLSEPSEGVYQWAVLPKSFTSAVTFALSAQFFHVLFHFVSCADVRISVIS